MIRPLLAIAIIGAVLFSLSSCTDEQIARVQQVVDQTDVRLAQANAAVALAEQACAKAKAIADQLGSEQAQRVVGQAEQALDQVKSARDIVQTTDKAAHSALDSAKEVQDAGGSTMGVVTAAAGGALPGIIAAVMAAMKWIQALRSFRQTVTGLDAAREQLGEEAWGAKVAPALSAAQDEATQKHVAIVLAKAA